MILPLNSETVENCLTLRRNCVEADVAALCLTMIDVSPNVRRIGERILSSAAEYTSQPGGYNPKHAQEQANYVALTCLMDMEYRRSN